MSALRQELDGARTSPRSRGKGAPECLYGAVGQRSVLGAERRLRQRGPVRRSARCGPEVRPWRARQPCRGPTPSSGRSPAGRGRGNGSSDRLSDGGASRRTELARERNRAGPCVVSGHRHRRFLSTCPGRRQQALNRAYSSHSEICGVMFSERRAALPGQGPGCSPA